MADEQCAVCNSKSNLKRCVRCRSVVYCSREHQIADWAAHKRNCHSSKKSDKSAGKMGGSSDCSETTTTQVSTRSSESDVYTEELTPNKLNMKTKKGNAGCLDHVETSTMTSGEKEDVKQTLIGVQCAESKLTPELSPFDQRPLNLATFTNTDGLDSEQIRQTIFSQLHNKGFCVLRGIFKDKICSLALDESRKLESDGQMRLGRLAGGKTSSLEMEKVTEINVRSDKMTWVEGCEDSLPAISEIVNIMDKTVSSFNGLKDCRYVFYNRTKVMVACYPGNGTFYRRHVDNPNKDGRIITCICYLNRNWDSQKHGGVLRLFPGDSDSYVDVIPESNTLLLFWSDRRSPHEVQPAFRTRYAVTAWFFDQTEREEAKIKAEEDRCLLQDEIAIAEFRTKELQKETLRVKVETESKRAVASLSKEEVEAIITMIRSHPEPEELLTGLGIAKTIQTELLRMARQQHK